MKSFLVRRLLDGTMHTIIAPNLFGKDGVFEQLLEKKPRRGEEFEIKERLSSEEWKRYEFR